MTNKNSAPILQGCGFKKPRTLPTQGGVVVAAIVEADETTVGVHATRFAGIFLAVIR